MTRQVRNSQSRDQFTEGPVPFGQWAIKIKPGRFLRPFFCHRKYLKYLNFYESNMNYLAVTENISPVQGNNLPVRRGVLCSSCDRKFIFCDKKYSFFHRKSALWHEGFFFIPVTGNKFPVTRNILSFTGKVPCDTRGSFLFLWQEIDFLWQEILCLSQEKFLLWHILYSFYHKLYSFCHKMFFLWHGYISCD